MNKLWVIAVILLLIFLTVIFSHRNKYTQKPYKSVKSLYGGTSSKMMSSPTPISDINYDNDTRVVSWNDAESSSPVIYEYLVTGSEDYPEWYQKNMTQETYFILGAGAWSSKYKVIIKAINEYGMSEPTMSTIKVGDYNLVPSTFQTQLWNCKDNMNAFAGKVTAKGLLEDTILDFFPDEGIDWKKTGTFGAYKSKVPGSTKFYIWKSYWNLGKHIYRITTSKNTPKNGGNNWEYVESFYAFPDTEKDGLSQHPEDALPLCILRRVDVGSNLVYKFIVSENKCISADTCDVLKDEDRDMWTGDSIIWVMKTPN